MNIENQFLNEQFVQYQSLKTKEAQQKFWKQFENNFQDLSDADKEKSKEGWLKNVSTIENRLTEIDTQLEKQKQQIFEIFPSNSEETHLIELLLRKMNVSFNLK